MSRFIADQNQVAFLYESGTYANTSGTGQWVGLITEHSIVDSENVEQIRYVGGGDRNVDIHVKGALDHEGTITYHPQDWKMLGFALGSMVDTGSPSPYAHNLAELNSNGGYAFTSGTLNPFASFTIEDSQSSAGGDGFNFVRTVKGAVINSMSISASAGEIIESEVEYLAQSVAFSSGVKTAVTAATSRPFQWSDVKVHIPSGTVIAEVTEMEFSLNNNLEPPHYLNGSRVIAPPIPQNRDYEMSLTLNGTSERTKTLYDQYFRGGSNFNMLLEINDASAGAGSRDMFMSLSGCRMTEMEATSPNENVNEQEITIVPKSASVIVNDGIELYNMF